MRQILPSLALAVLGLVLWSLYLFFPLAAIHLPVGRSTATDVQSALGRMAGAEHWALFLAVAVTLIVFPALRLASVLAVPLVGTWGRVPRAIKWWFLSSVEARRWGMVDVFLLGAMIALLRLRDWGHIEFGWALVAFSGVTFCSLVLDSILHPGAFLDHYTRRSVSRAGEGAKQPVIQRTIVCHHCDALCQRQEGARCDRCEKRLWWRKPNSLERTWALCIAAALLIGPANFLPVLTMHHMRERGTKTIYGGVVDLAESDNWGLAILVFVASIIVPVVKLLVMVILLVLTHRRSGRALRLRARAHRFVSIIGRWSMIDIFAALMLFSLARFGWFGSVYPEAGAIAFCAVVFLTMLASESFDARLMWDRAGKNAEVATS